MKVIFIRHAEPDYSIDSLTEKGQREAQLLAQRTRYWEIDDIYCSPLGRAQATAKPTLEILKREAITKDWLREFEAPVERPDRPGRKSVCWDFFPGYLYEHPEFFDTAAWSDSPILSASHVGEQYHWVCQEFDALLDSYGYHRDQTMYRTDGTRPASDAFMRYDGTTIARMESYKEKEPVIVCFCHLGITLTLISHLLNTSPMAMLHGFFIAPSSVTVLSSEERTPGEVRFRCQMLGDTSHLRIAGEPVSFYGSFANPFQL